MSKISKDEVSLFIQPKLKINEYKLNKNTKSSHFYLFISFFTILQFLLIIYLLISHSYLEKEVEEIKRRYNEFNYENSTLISDKNIENEIKKLNKSYDYLNKQIYILYSEVNITKLHCFYEIRTQKLKNKNISYSDNKIILFSDYLNWLIIHDTNYLKGYATDKITSCKNYVTKKLGQDICKEIIKIYDSPDDINISELPEKFVIKANHGSEMNIIVKDKKEFVLEDVKNQLYEWLRTDYGILTKEFHYSYIKPKLFAEKFIDNKNNLLEYRFFIFNHKIKTIDVAFYEKDVKYFQSYDEKWNFIPNTNIDIRNKYTIGDDKKFKPKNLELMIKYAYILSEDFKHVRIDFLEHDGQIFFNELTFTNMGANPNAIFRNFVLDKNDVNFR